MARNVQQTATRVGNPAGNPNVPPTAQKRARWFVALFDYDPSTMSPNPDACEEELPFTEGDTIKVWGDKDADGFYWGECRSRRGYVPHNMVMEVEGGNQNRDRWGDIYASLPVKKMVALYDYDPQELSPNVDAEVELSFTTGQIISVYGEMDDDGFYMAEIEGARGLVPSNFLTEAPDQYSTGVSGQTSTSQQARGQRGRGHGPGARGPPPPPRENTARPIKRDACPVLPSQLDNATNTATPNTQVFTEHQVARARGEMTGARGGNLMGMGMGQTQPTLNSTNTTTSSNVTQPSGIFGSSINRIQHKGLPQVLPTVNQVQPPGQFQQQQQQQTPQAAQPNLMQKLNEITAPGGDILSKGKELIFMKFGLGGK